MGIIRKLTEQGVLGMNARIGRYMNPLNDRRYYPLVDDKVKTAQLAKEYGVPAPANYRVFDSYGDLHHLGRWLETHASFVVKPARGSMGNGILVITEARDGEFTKANGDRLSLEDLHYHMGQVMSGLYSIAETPDKAIVQYKVATHPVFVPFVHAGVPDVRVIVFKGYPIMAMTRLPTRESGGRANLHQGAVAVGIDMLLGHATHAIHRDVLITRHPDTQAVLSELRVPHWSDLLLIAARCYDIAPLGYLGVDLVIDRDLGPMMLEMNARPGLSIQVANMKGLKKVLDYFEPRVRAGFDPPERARHALEISSALA